MQTPPHTRARGGTVLADELVDGVRSVPLCSPPCLDDLVQTLCKLVPDATPLTAAAVRPSAKQLLRGAGHAVKFLHQQNLCLPTAVRAAVLEYLATSKHCCEPAAREAMFDARVVELIASILHGDSGSDAHLQGQACRLLAVMAYQLGSVAPFKDEESRIAQLLFPDAMVATLVKYMKSNLDDTTRFTMALTAAMKAVCDSKVAKRFNEHGLVMMLEDALALCRVHLDVATEVRVLRFLWQFLRMLPEGSRLPSPTLVDSLFWMLPPTAASPWSLCDYVRLMVLTRTMRWTHHFTRKTLKRLRAQCVSVFTKTVTPENVLRGFCCLYIFSVLCIAKTAKCALEGTEMPGAGLCGVLLDETGCIKESVFWREMIKCYAGLLRLPLPVYGPDEQQQLVVLEFLRQQCWGDILSKYVEPGVVTAEACQMLLNCCRDFACEDTVQDPVQTLHHMHLATVSVQRVDSHPTVVMAALGIVRSCAALTGSDPNCNMHSALPLEIIFSMDREHLRCAGVCKAVVESLDWIVRGSSDVSVQQDTSSACVLQVSVRQEHARMVLFFLAENLLLLAACATDATFAALVCHVVQGPEDITILLTHGLNVAYIIEFFGVKVIESCAFFGVWLLAGLLRACVEKKVPTPRALESLACTIGPKSIARALEKLETASVAGCTVTPLAFTLYFWYMLVSAIDNVFDEHARKVLAATAGQCATGGAKRFADMLSDMLEACQERRKQQQTLALKKADALLEELMHEKQANASAGEGKSKRSRRQRRAAKSVPAAVDGALGLVHVHYNENMREQQAARGGRDFSPGIAERHCKSPRDPFLAWDIRRVPDMRICPEPEHEMCIGKSQGAAANGPVGTVNVHSADIMRKLQRSAAAFGGNDFSPPPPRPWLGVADVRCLSGPEDELCMIKSQGAAANGRSGTVNVHSKDIMRPLSEPEHAMCISKSQGAAANGPVGTVNVHSKDIMRPLFGVADVRCLSEQEIMFMTAQMCAAKSSTAANVEDVGGGAGAHECVLSPDSVRADDAFACAPQGAGGKACNPAVECTMCFEEIEEQNHWAFVPCGHVCMCHDCALQQKTCPLCRSDVQVVMKLFYS